jgi:PAS domain S-box-containing protein
MMKNRKEEPLSPNPLGEVRSQLQSLLQALPDVVYFKDELGRNLVFNKAFEALAGAAAEDIIGRTDDDLLPPDLAEKCRESDEQTIRSGAPIRFEEKSAAPDGRHRHYETIKAPIFDENRRIIGLVGVSRDITERKVWEERLAESEERFRSLFENTTVGLYRTSPDGRIIMANPALIRMLGFMSFEELSVRNLQQEGFEPRYWREHFVKRIEEGGEIRGLEAAWKRLDGSTIFVRESARVIRDQEGRTLYYEGTVEDITEKKRAEQVREESERRFRTIFETAQELIFLKNRELRYTLVNPAMERLFGLPANRIVGMSDEDLFDGETADYNACLDRRVLAGESVTDESIKTVNGKPRSFNITKVPIRNETGTIIGLCGIARDTTERKRMEEALHQSVREKELLLKETHHRVKNNMQIISSILNLQAKSIKDPVALEGLKMCQSRIRSMSLIHEKLYRSRDISSVDFGEYVRSLAAALLHSCQIDPDRVKLRFETDEVFLDMNTAIPCGLIVNELVLNALKHAFPRRKAGEVRIALARNESGDCVLTVSDTGVGFPKNLDFRKTDSLGLQLVNLLVEQIGGTIRMRRAGGTKFEIAFPERKDNTAKNG